MEGKKGMYDIAEICRFHGVEHAILCPGSRCAPLTLAFSRTSGIRCSSVVDERSAAFIALGLAETTRKPVVLICTSGTAVLNFAPALAEAYYRRIPLLVLTADRPQRLVNQHDGQTMNQPGVYANYIRESFWLNGDIRTDEELAYLHRTVNAALIRATAEFAGPVHINLAFEEPLYKLADSTGTARFISAWRGTEQVKACLDEAFGSGKNKWLLVVGSRRFSAAENQLLAELARCIPVSVEAVSNAADAGGISNANELVRRATEDERQALAPDVLVTFGNGIVSKNLKKFLRSHKPSRHIHIDVNGELIDTYQCLTDVWTVSDEAALRGLRDAVVNQTGNNYRSVWMDLSYRAAERVGEVVPSLPFGDLRAMDFVTRNLPSTGILHVANSMPVRYLNLFGVHLSPEMEVYCNRGTSGIDGSISTAIGNAVGSGKSAWIITGDLSFQYDGNALWNGLLPADLHIIIVNNSGGGIFRLIEGPSSVPELTERFETRTQTTARFKAEQFGLDYETCHSEADLQKLWPRFVATGTRAKILEIFTDPIVNETVFTSFQQQLSKTI